jgi:myo-inositol-1(or 4)-monophosphatase
LAYVARGSLEGSWAPHTNSWDVLAGMLLVQEAGGWVNEFMAGQGLTSGNPILSSAPGMVEFFRSVCGV